MDEQARRHGLTLRSDAARYGVSNDRTRVPIKKTKRPRED
jgi:hypothetical protein